jgi:hypothetical protein
MCRDTGVRKPSPNTPWSEPADRWAFESRQAYYRFGLSRRSLTSALGDSVAFILFTHVYFILRTIQFPERDERIRPFGQACCPFPTTVLAGHTRKLPGDYLATWYRELDFEFVFSESTL